MISAVLKSGKKSLNSKGVLFYQYTISYQIPATSSATEGWLIPTEFSAHQGLREDASRRNRRPPSPARPRNSLIKVRTKARSPHLPLTLTAVKQRTLPPGNQLLHVKQQPVHKASRNTVDFPF